MTQIKLDRNLDIVKKRDVDGMTFRQIALFLSVTEKAISETAVRKIYVQTKKKYGKCPYADHPAFAFADYNKCPICEEKYEIHE